MRDFITRVEKQKCLETKGNGNMVCADKGESTAQYKLENNKKAEIVKIAIDGCLIKEGIKCDWLLLIVSEHIAVFIELKGDDYYHGCEQLAATIEQIKPKLEAATVFARLSVSSFNFKSLPKTITDARHKKLMRLLGNADRFLAGRSVLTENLSQLIQKK